MSTMAAVARPYSTLGDLENNPVKREIIVRVIRLWETRNRSRESQVLSLNLLLLDELGILIKARINHRLISYYKTILKEGSIYHISQFDVEQNNGRFKLTDHKYGIQFTHLTIPSEVIVDLPTIGRTKFRIHGYDTLVRLANTNQNLADVEGRITYVWGSCLRTVGSTHKIMAKIVLKDGKKARVSIWDHIASEFRAFLTATQHQKCVVIISAVNHKLFAGGLYLNTSPATRFYVSDALEGVNNLCQQSEEDENSILEEMELDEDDSSTKTISQMFSFLDIEEPQEKEFYCSAKIVEIITQNGWYTISCGKCFNRIKTADKKLICSYCEDIFLMGIARFRIEVIVDDETDQARFVIFDKEARMLTNMLAEDLVAYEASNATAAKQHELPACLLELIGRNYVFQLRLTEFDFKAREKTFSVAGILNGPVPNSSAAAKQKVNQFNAEEKAKDSKVPKRRSGRNKRKHII